LHAMTCARPTSLSEFWNLLLTDLHEQEMVAVITFQSLYHYGNPFTSEKLDSDKQTLKYRSLALAFIRINATRYTRDIRSTRARRLAHNKHTSGYWATVMMSMTQLVKAKC
jgi:hypothetical protein